MSMFDFDGDGSFDMEDAAVIGGMMGFAEESMREEDRNPDEVSDHVTEEDKEEIDRVTSLRLLRNENPGLVDYLINLVKTQRKRWSIARRQRERDMADFEEVKHELEAMKRTGCDEIRHI